MTHRSATAMMPVGHDTGNAEIVWRPNADYLERSRLRRFMAREGIASFEELLDAARRTIPRGSGTRRSRTSNCSSTALRAGGGPLARREWATWFTGGQYNYVHNALDKHAERKQRR